MPNRGLVAKQKGTDSALLTKTPASAQGTPVPSKETQAARDLTPIGSFDLRAWLVEDESMSDSDGSDDFESIEGEEVSQQYLSKSYSS